MEFRDRTERVNEGEIIIVPKGVEHFPRTENGEEVWVLLFEPKATKHTGEVLTKKQPITRNGFEVAFLFLRYCL